MSCGEMDDYDDFFDGDDRLEELEEAGLTVFDPYRGSTDLATFGDGLQTAVEDLQGHDKRLVELECFAAGREKCMGDAVFDLMEARDSLQLTRLRMLALALVFGLLGMVAVLGTVLTMSAEVAELQERTSQLEGMVIDTHHDTSRALKRMEVASKRGYRR